MALVVGILSILLSGCFVLGLVLGILGLVRFRRAQYELAMHPVLRGESMNEAGRICCIVGIFMSLAFAALWVVCLSFLL